MRLPFATNEVISPEETALRAWLKKNRETLADRQPYEVATLAITCGFEANVVYRTLCNFRDAMDGSSLENRAAFKGWLTDQAFEEVMKMRRGIERAKELDLMPFWKELVAHTVTGEPIELKEII